MNHEQQEAAVVEMTGEMYSGPRGGEAAPREGQAPELDSERMLPPRIYVASLSDYNAGRLHGAWVTASESAEEIYAAIGEMLAASPVRGAEEWAIHDHEGFGAWEPSEWERVESIAEVAGGIVAHGLAYAAWRSWNATAPAEEFEDDYLGEWPSVEAYAGNLVDDVGVTIAVDPLSWEPYVRFDTETFARDLEFELHSAPSPDGGVWLFQYR